MTLTARQFISLFFVSFITIIFRLLPILTEISGKSAWLAPIISLPFLLIFHYTLYKYLKKRRDLKPISKDKSSLAKILFNFFSIIICILAIFYALFVAYQGANRLIMTIYPDSDAIIFVLCLVLLGLYALKLGAKVLSRSAEIFLPILGFTLAILVVSGLFKLDFGLVFPIEIDVKSLIYASAVCFIVLTAGTLTLTLLFSYAEEIEWFNRDFRRFLVLMSLLISAICFVVIGNLGATLTAESEYSFFLFIRNIKILGLLERTEAILTAIWVFSDFVLVSVMLVIARENFHPLGSLIKGAGGEAD